MGIAFLLTVILGILWSMVGAVVSIARSRNCPIWGFYTCGSVFAALMLCVCGLFHISELRNCSLLPIGLLFAGALLNALGQALIMYNLKGGARALLFAIPQMNFMVVFLFSVIFLKEELSAFSVTGISLLFIAVLGAVLSKNSDTALPNWKQLILAISAALIGGISQCAILIAGIRGAGCLSAGTQSVLKLLFSAFSYGVGALSEWKSIRSANRSIMKYGFYWGIFAALSYYVLFLAIPAMNALGRGGLVFAIACSTAILAFWVFSVFRMKDAFSWKQAFLMSAIILGVILLCI